MSNWRFTSPTPLSFSDNEQRSERGPCQQRENESSSGRKASSPNKENAKLGLSQLPQFNTCHCPSNR